MNLQDYIDVGVSADLPCLQGRLVDFAHRLEFSYVSVALGLERPGEPPRFALLGNAPKAFQEAPRKTEDLRRDPVLMRMKHSSVPFLYDQDLYVQAGCGDLWEEQAPHGFRTGISVAMHMPGGCHFLLGVDRDTPLPREDADLSRLFADLQLLAVYAQDASLRLLMPAAEAQWSRPELPALTAREREVMQWTAQGKSAWAVGQLLSMSEHTVNFHLRNVMRKLDVGTKHQAVLKLMEGGAL
jgi:DNA-binding CsgD family transcriptional regulator